MERVWKEQETEHYIFYYKTESKAEKEIQKVIELQEGCFKEITDKLGVVPEKKIIYWLCDSRAELVQISGFEYEVNGVTFLERENPTIYAVYNEEVRCVGYHEDVHAISYQYACPNSIAIIEGLAMYFDKEWWKISNELCTCVYIQDKKYKKVESMILDDDYFYGIEDMISYPIMGAFTNFLIERYGMKKYMEVYQNCDEWKLAFLHIYEASIQLIENEFIEWILSSGYSTEQIDNARKVLYAEL